MSFGQKSKKKFRIKAEQGRLCTVTFLVACLVSIDSRPQAHFETEETLVIL